MSVSLQRYGMWFAGITVVLIALILAMRSVIGFNLSPALVVVIPALAAAMLEGARYAKTTRSPLPAPWTDALGMTAVALGLLVVVAVPLVFGPAGIPITWALAAFAFCGVLWLGTNRLFLTLGARNEWASQDRGDA
ncbi:MAG: ABZJ_00895 family protein [Pseudomonadota bacterium]